MDDPTRESVRLVPDRRFTLAAAAGLAVAVVAIVLAQDGPTRLIAAVAAVVLGGYAICDLLFSPRLEADAAGVVIRSPMTRATLAWGEIEHVRADVTTRHGLRAITLEIDAGPVLAVLSRRSIGVDPEHAAELIRACRPVENGRPLTR